jgi:hypothetical protein
MADLADIKERFDGNVARVENLVALYTELTGNASGRATVQESDLLRASIVLLHAALEDLVRSVAELKLPSASEGVLDEIPLSVAEHKYLDKFSLGKLTLFRGYSVDDVLRDAVKKYLERVSYSDYGQIAKALGQCGFETRDFERFGADIQAMTRRRHHIAHRADVDLMPGQGHHHAKSIDRSQVEEWTGVVKDFGNEVIAGLEGMGAP